MWNKAGRIFRGGWPIIIAAAIAGAIAGAALVSFRQPPEDGPKLSSFVAANENRDSEKSTPAPEPKPTNQPMPVDILFSQRDGKYVKRPITGPLPAPRPAYEEHDDLGTAAYGLKSSTVKTKAIGMAEAFSWSVNHNDELRVVRIAPRFKLRDPGTCFYFDVEVASWRNPSVTRQYLLRIWRRDEKGYDGDLLPRATDAFGQMGDKAPD